MRKQYFMTLMILFLSIALWAGYHTLETDAARDTLSRAAIRFHVRANSDSTADQQLKMAVKEQVVHYIYEETGDFDTVAETRDFLRSHNAEILQIARDTIQAQGYDYPVQADFGLQEFPEKTYGDVVFPAGTYTSYTLSIGNGKGHNWWCVLYPPLCFVDASTGIVPDSSKERLQESLTDQEYHAVVKYRFKYLTFLNQYLD